MDGDIAACGKMYGVNWKGFQLIEARFHGIMTPCQLIVSEIGSARVELDAVILPMRTAMVPNMVTRTLLYFPMPVLFIACIARTGTFGNTPGVIITYQLKA